MGDADDKVMKLDVRFKKPPDRDGPLLTVADRFAVDCDHRWRWVNGDLQHVNYLIREGETEVECGLCHTRLDPMFVLKVLAGRESEWHRRRMVYQDEMKRLRERERTKCQHCGNMTRISRR